MTPREKVPTTADRDPIVLIDTVHKAFGDLDVLDGVDLTVDRGSVICLLGRSGSGKTTLLRCINSLEKLDRGSIWVDGEMVGNHVVRGQLRQRPAADVQRMRSEIGMVFQHFNLFSHKTALENIVEAPVGVLRRDRSQAIDDARELLEWVGLPTKADSYPAMLSGGQQQRVAIARALAMRPKLLLFDEPTSALDPELVGDVLSVMRRVAETGTTMIVVTHELSFARAVADTVVFMEGGHIIESGPPDEVMDNPATTSLRSFLHTVNRHRSPHIMEATPPKPTNLHKAHIVG